MSSLRPSAPLPEPGSPRYWRSLEELADTPEFREAVAREFPRGAELFAGSRRGFLKLMGASLALAGITGCMRWPEETLLPEGHRPDNRIPGQPVHYATAIELGGIAQGLLVTSVDGRPIKIEGNPQHPLNQGAADAFAQASVLSLYDPDRSRGVSRRQGNDWAESSWKEFEDWAAKNIPADGEGLYILSGTTSSPSVAGLREDLQKKRPKTQWFEYEPLSDDNLREGRGEANVLPGQDAKRALPQRPVLELAKARVIVSLDADLFGGASPAAIKYARDFAAGRRLDGPAPEMTRLYVFEPVHSITGACADHRIAVRPGAIAAIAIQIAGSLGLLDGSRKSEPIASAPAVADNKILKQVAADLKANAGRSLVTAGPRQPAAVQALVAAINDKLENTGKTVLYYPEPDRERPTHLSAIQSLVAEMRAGKVKTLLILGGNPVYNAPADLEFGKALAKVPNSVHLAMHRDETSLGCHWHVSQSHPLESWGDARSPDGTMTVVQPLIEPLFDGRSTIEVLAMLLGKDAGENNPQQIVRKTIEESVVLPRIDDWAWAKALAEGLVAGTASQHDVEGVLTISVPKIDLPPGLDLVFTPDAKVYDGRFANNAWLQELPDPMTRLTWDNAALMSAKTAEELGVTSDDVVKIEADGRELEAPVLVLPGMAEKVIALSLGYGRTAAGSVGSGVGCNAYALRTAKNMGWVSGVRVTKTGKTHRLATVQDHHLIDAVGRKAVQDRIPQLVVEGTLEQYRKDPTLGVKRTGLLSMFDERPFDGRASDDPKAPPGHKWGMVVDLGACTGCGACVVACQAENNIPVVGKEQVLLGREMHWIRVDRYFRGDVPDQAAAVHQPVLCMHCENAPCEAVCPVAATTHSREGLNMMTYNRCIGVRYCANNCPYKVRRFNYFDFNRGTLDDEYLPNAAREPVSDLIRMQKNPEVTVRSRGVMEKCTYCVQRIERARTDAKREGDRAIRPGEIRTACQQSCPARAIVFGDLNDPASEVSKLYAQQRAYGMLDDYLNTKPRTVYLARVRNEGEGPGASG